MSYLQNSTGYPLYSQDMLKGQGCYVYDAGGKQYLDLEAGVWALPLGHNDPDVKEAMLRQMGQIMHVGYKYNHPVTETCAEKLLQIADMDGGKCVFLTSGSEAVEYGVRLAKALRPDKRFMCLKGQYLSAYGLCGQQEDSLWELIQWDDHDRKDKEAWYRQLKNEIDFDKIGVFVFEPGNSSGLVKLPPPGLVAALVKIVQEYHIITVVDEVTCGIGRTGEWFGFMHYGLKPNIIAAGKGIGNGYPVSAVIFTGAMSAGAEKIDFHFAQSHQNDPMGCSVAYEVLSKIEREDMLSHAARIGEYFRNAYRKLEKELSYIQEIRGIGLLNCIELSGSVPEEAMMKIDKMLFEHGIIAGVKPKEKVIRTYCPLIITTGMIDHYIDVLKAVLKIVLA